ncbi:FAD-binding oxidoreductase [Leisingera aquaemixtae]|uniref:FAD-binding oxidoreductase n=1 Tax=Leisingera aquaemixtae TaxID=1396826 RepID=A0ABY5WN24_9RHOB|nr:FAD-binding oxidoreductase [Leisingera aquaemixtae]UWQ42866.1 FAD-binding oxidoreductase [Leisingera aquaemixtae]
MRGLSGWGNYPVSQAQLLAPRSEAELQELIASNPSVIARGNGRAYGDSAVGVPATLHMRHFDKMISFDAQTGLLVAESGVLLGDIISAFLPRGWFPAVVPGTKFVTLGGAIAADVHGKNHHKDGSFRSCLDWVEVMGPDGTVRRCSPQENTELFNWTAGGMGLTGVILRAAIRLRRVPSAWIRQQTIPAANLEAAIEIFERSAAATYSVAWIDCLSGGGRLGRSLVMLGEHAGLQDLSYDQAARPFAIPRVGSRTVPPVFPSFALNRFSVRAFNAAYFWTGARKAGRQITDFDSYFFPLDALLGWNRIYGRKGFAQFQCVLPLDSARPGLCALLQAISAAGQGSFLAVLKRLGAQDSPFSFPMEGYTLALDFPVNRCSLQLMQDLDRITIAHGGRFYLAKDSRMSRDTLHAADPRAAEFTGMRQLSGLHPSFQSAQSQRLSL